MFFEKILNTSFAFPNFKNGQKCRQYNMIDFLISALSYLTQLQDAGCWDDAATLAATHLKGADYARFTLSR